MTITKTRTTDIENGKKKKSNSHTIQDEDANCSRYSYVSIVSEMSSKHQFKSIATIILNNNENNWPTTKQNITNIKRNNEENLFIIRTDIDSDKSGKHFKISDVDGHIGHKITIIYE